MIAGNFFFKRCLYFCWTTLAVAVILFAFLVSATRMMIPLLSDYRQNFESVASSELGRTVTIGKIDAEWIGLWPKIHLVDVDIQGASSSKTWMRASDVWLSVDLLSLLTKGYLDAERVKINGLQLSVQRIKEALYLINNEPVRLDQSSSGDKSALVEWLFSRDLLQLSNSKLTYSDDRYGAQKIDLSEVNLSLENNNNEHHVFGRFKVPGERSSELNFIVNLNGDMLKPQEVMNSFYVKGDLFASSTLEQWVSPFARINHGEIFLELWGRGHLYRLEQVKAKINANKLKWKVPAEDALENSSEIDNLQALFFWQRDKEGWRLNVKDMILKQAGSQWPASDMRVVYQKAGSGVATLEGSVSFLRLQDIGRLVSSNIPDTFKIKKIMKKLNAHGDFSDISFSFSGTKDQLDQFYFNSNVSKVGYEKWGSVPGLSNLEGVLTVSSDKGVLKINSKHVTLDFGELFPAPLTFDEIKGDVFWQSKGDGVVISFDRLKLDNDHVQSSVRANIKIPGKGLLPFLDIQAEFKNGIVKHIPLYVPRILSKGSHEWIDAAFKGGVIPSGKMIYHGSVADYPFINNKGTFIVDFNVNNVSLNYGQSWPDIKNLNAHILIKDDSMDISIATAEAMQIKVLPSILKLDHLNSDTFLTSNMKFQGKLQQLLRYMHDSPIGDGSRDFIEKMSATGSVFTSVVLEMPLQDIKNFRLQGLTEFQNNKVVLKEWKQVFDKVTGELHFENRNGRFKYSSKNLTTTFYGKPASINVNTIRTKSAGLLTTATLRAILPTASLMSPVMNVVRIIKGESDWKITLSFFEDKKSTLRATSNMKGTTISLPDGFFKQASAKRQVSFQLNMLDGKVDDINFNMNKRFKSVFRLSTGKTKELLDGEIGFGDVDVKLSKNKGIRIKGYLGVLSLDEWQAFLPVSKTRMNDMSMLKKINAINLSIGEIKTGLQSFRKVKIKAKEKTGQFEIKVSSSEVTGVAAIPYRISSDSPVKLDLKYLSWLKAENPSEDKVVDPRLLPSVDLKISKFLLNKKTLGAVVIKMREHRDGLTFNKISIKGPSLNVTGQGSWLFRQSWHESDISLKVSAPVIDNALALFDFKSGIEDGAVEAQLQAAWAGPPHWFEMKRLDGTVYLQIKNGSLRDIDPGSGRIFGLLNVQTVRRRLSLDFNDLFKKGFGFDKIEGRFSIADGDAYTNDLYLDGPAARIDIQGRIGLAAEDYDETVLVSPKLSSTIPLLGLAAGPQVALGLLLTEKLFRKRINKLSVTRYSVTGPWDKPVVTKITSDDEDINLPEGE